MSGPGPIREKEKAAGVRSAPLHERAPATKRPSPPVPLARAKSGRDWTQQVYEFRVGREVPATLARAAKQLADSGGPISTRELRPVVRDHGRLDDAHRLFLAGLLDRENARTLARTPIGAGATIRFSLASIQAGMPLVKTLVRRRRIASAVVAQRVSAPRHRVAAVLGRSTTSPPTPPSTRKATITERDRAEIKADVERIVAELRAFHTDDWKITGFVLKWADRDDVHERETGYGGAEYIDAFVLETQKRVYTRRTFSGAAWLVEQHGIVYDDVWNTLSGTTLEVWKDRVSKSRWGSTAARQGPPENFWKTLGKQEAIGLWAMLKGMGTTAAGGLIDAPARAIVHVLREEGIPAADPESAAAWLAKQYDIVGEAGFGTEYSKGDPLFLGMTATDIGSTGGAAIWQLVMLGKGGGGSAWAARALQLIGIGGSLDGVYSSAEALAKIVEAKRVGGARVTASALANDPEFRREATNLVANIVATVAGVLGAASAKPDAAMKATIKAWEKAGFVLNATQVAERLGACIQEGLGAAPPAEKESKIASALGEALSQAVFLGLGAHQGEQEMHSTPGASTADHGAQPPPAEPTQMARPSEAGAPTPPAAGKASGRTLSAADQAQQLAVAAEMVKLMGQQPGTAPAVPHALEPGAAAPTPTGPTVPSPAHEPSTPPVEPPAAAAAPASAETHPPASSEPSAPGEPAPAPAAHDAEVEAAFGTWESPPVETKPLVGGSAELHAEITSTKRPPLSPEDLFHGAVIPHRAIEATHKEGQQPDAIPVSAHSQVRTELEQKQPALAAAEAALAAEPNSKALKTARNKVRWERDLLANRLAVSALPGEAQTGKGGRLDIRGENTVAALQIIDSNGVEIAVVVDHFKGGNKHAETEGVGTLDKLLARKVFSEEQLKGATMRVVGDQTVCPDVCRPALRAWAAKYQLATVESHYFTRPKYVGTGQATPKTTSKTFLQAPPKGQPSPPALKHHVMKIYSAP
jgi:hypothetical protein